MSSLRSYETLKTNDEFNDIYKLGKKWHCKGAVIFYKSSPEKLVGFVASKKVGNAVKRVYAKRRMRAAFISLQDDLNVGTYVFVAKPDIFTLTYDLYLKNILWSFGKLRCLTK